MLQRSVPARMIGRVSSLDWVLSLGLAPLSYALTGPIADALGAQGDAALVRGSSSGVVLLRRAPLRAERSQRRDARGRERDHGSRGLVPAQSRHSASLLSSVGACSRARSRTRSSASSRGASTSRCTSTTASPASRSSVSSTAPCRRRSTASAAASPRRSSSCRTAASRSTSRRRSCARKAPSFDLPIALAILAASRQFPAGAARGARGGRRARPRRTAAPRRRRARGRGGSDARVDRQADLPRRRRAAEAALAGVEPVPVAAPRRGRRVPARRDRARVGAARTGTRPEVRLPDLADVRGHERARRALEIAAAGRHNLLLAGPPGTGKTMLARRLPGVLPPLEPVRGARGDAHPFRRRARLARAAADLAAAVSRAAPQRLDGGDRRRRPGTATRRGDARAPRRAAPRRAAGVPASGARGAAAAARGRRRRDRACGGRGVFPARFQVVANDESVCLRRARRSRRPSAPARRSGSRRSATSSRARCSTASTSSSPCRGRARSSSRRRTARRPSPCAPASSRRGRERRRRARPPRTSCSRGRSTGCRSPRAAAHASRASRARSPRSPDADAVAAEHVAEALAYRSPRELDR